MKAKKFIPWIITALSLSLAAGFVYKQFFYKPIPLPYVTQKPKRRTIAKIIDTSGKLNVAEKVKIGSLVSGIIKKLYVDENEEVKKGQLLAEIDTGKGDTEVRQAEGILQKTYAHVTYQEHYYARQKELFSSGQVAKDEFEKITRDYVDSKAEHIVAQAQYDKAKQEFDNTKIYAPQDGIIIKVGITQGERVTTDLDATVLFEIAQDITKMEALLEIDESDIGHIKLGQKVDFTVDSYPQKIFTTTIQEISYSPKKKKESLHYKATIPVCNKELLLRPGLSVNAKIFIAKSKKALTIPSQAFMISTKVLREIAKELDYSFHPFDKKKYKKKLKAEGEQLQTIWVVQKNGFPHSFVEKMVKTNLTDDIRFEVIEGVHENDDVIIDIEETDYMEEIFKKAFSSRF